MPLLMRHCQPDNDTLQGHIYRTLFLLSQHIYSKFSTFHFPQR